MTSKDSSEYCSELHGFFPEGSNQEVVRLGFSMPLLNIGSFDGWRKDFIDKLKKFIKRNETDYNTTYVPVF